MSYKRLTEILADCWDKPWVKLSAEQQWAWFSTTNTFRSSMPSPEQVVGSLVHDDGSWDMNTIDVRRHRATEYDAEHDPVLRTIGWHDYSMNAATWFAMPDVAPRDAAMVLSRINPHDRDWRGDPPDPERVYPDDDRSSPGKYRLLLAMFEAVARTSSAHRTLREWLVIAQEKDFQYHPWIDKYLAAQIALSRTDDTSTPNMTVMAPSNKRRLTNNEVVAAFKLAYADENYWVNATSKKWPKSFVTAQIKGKPGGYSSTYNPIELATALLNKPYNVLPRDLTKAFTFLRTIDAAFSGWADEWSVLNKDI